MTKKTEKILENLANAGAFNKVVWRRDMKTRKDVLARVEKIVTAVVSAGTDYANRKSIKDAIESGERGEVQALPWGAWLDFPRVIVHTPKGQTEQVEYIRLYPPSAAQYEAFKHLEAKAQYFVNGQPASADEVKPLCLASEFRENDAPVECFTVKAESIIAIGETAI